MKNSLLIRVVGHTLVPPISTNYHIRYYLLDNNQSPNCASTILNRNRKYFYSFNIYVKYKYYFFLNKLN